MSTAIAAALVIVSLISLCLITLNEQKGRAQNDEASFTPYTNPTFGVRTEYPSDWGRIDLSFLQNNSADIEFYPLDDPSAIKQVKIQIETMPMAQNMTLQGYTDVKINSVEGQILESNGTSLADLPAHQVVSANSGIKMMQVWTIEGDKVYTVTYVAEEEDFEEDLQLAERLIQSFEITE